MAALLLWGALAQQPSTKAAPADQPANIPPLSKPQGNARPQTGETLVYGAEWRVFNAGTATLRLEQSGQDQRVLGTADATGAVALLYHVRDRYESAFDASSFCSKKITKNIEEGLRKVDTNIVFDYQRSKAVLDQKNIKKNETKHTENDIPACVTDILSAFYYVGSLPLEPGKTFSFPLNDGGKTVTVDVHAEAKEQVKTPAGTFNTIRVQPDVPSGVLKGKGKIWIWYAEDLRMPVRLRGKLFWGTVTFTLQRIERK